MRCCGRRWILGGLLVMLWVSPVWGQVLLSDVRFTAFGGPAFWTGASSRPYQMGLSVDGSLARVTAQAGLGFLVEGGAFRPAISGTGSYYFSADAVVAPLRLDFAEEGSTWRPFAAAGYTRMLTASSSAISQTNAVNFGVGVDRVLRDDLWLRLEVRDQYAPASNLHALVLRVGLVGAVSGR